MLTSSGQPAPGAQVRVLADPQAGIITIRNGVFASYDDQIKSQDLIVATGPDGRFIVPPLTGDFRVVALSDDGFAQVTRKQLLDSGNQVKLAPWGKIEGQLVPGGKPAVGEDIRVYLMRSEHVDVSSTAVTDEQGRFVVDHIAPGRSNVNQVLRIGAHAGNYGRGKWVTVRAGGSAKVKLGREGRPVKGRLVLPENLKPLLTEQWDRRSHLSVDFDSRGSSPWGYGYSPDLFCRPDGSFETNETPAGTWTLEVRLFEGNSSPMTLLKREVVVPDMPGGSSEEPLDLGDITVPAPQTQPATTQPTQ